MNLFSSRAERSMAVTYFVSVALTVLVLVINYTLKDVLFDHSEYVLAVGAVTLSAWYGGGRVGMITAIISTIAVNYVLVEPYFYFGLGLPQVTNMLLFLIVALLVCWTESHRSRSEHALREARDELHIILDGVKDGILVQREDGQPIFVNQAAATLVGYKDPVSMMNDTGAARAQRFTIMDADEKPISWDDLPRARVFRTGQPVTQAFRMRDSDTGQDRWINQKSAPVFNDKKRTRAVVSILQDVTVRTHYEESLRETAEELRRSNEELEMFAYVASHDLQEPLRMVASYLQLIEQRYAERLDTDGMEFIGYAVDGAQRMKTLINDLLLYSRVQRAKLELGSVSVEAAFEQVKNNLQMAITDSGAVITSDTLPVVTANEGQIIQLLQNLVGNAMKFHGDNPPAIHVSVKREDRFWLFSVRDNGIGIKKEYLERIFVIFQRLHGRGTHPGTGIGLAICKKIVERHGGRIWVESQPGEGSTFYFTLPVSVRKVNDEGR